MHRRGSTGRRRLSRENEACDFARDLMNCYKKIWNRPGGYYLRSAGVFRALREMRIYWRRGGDGEGNPVIKQALPDVRTILGFQMFRLECRRARARW